MTNGEVMIKTIESVMGVEFDKSFDWRELGNDVVIAFDGSWWRKENTMTDRIKLCDVVECEDCPRFADDCDGEAEDD